MNLLTPVSDSVIEARPLPGGLALGERLVSPVQLPENRSQLRVPNGLSRLKVGRSLPIASRNAGGAPRVLSKVR